jgi:hypothetical protein
MNHTEAIASIILGLLILTVMGYIAIKTIDMSRYNGSWLIFATFYGVFVTIVGLLNL